MDNDLRNEHTDSLLINHTQTCLLPYYWSVHHQNTHNMCSSQEYVNYWLFLILNQINLSHIHVIDVITIYTDIV